MNELIFDTLNSYNEYLEKIPKGCQEIADLIREDKIHEAMQGILDFSNGTSWLIEVKELMKPNNINIELETEKINEFLNEVNNGLGIEDYVIVADMFEYEIKPFFEESTKYLVVENQ